MSDKKLFIVYGSNNSHFLNLETAGKFVFQIFTEKSDIDLKEFFEEFRIPYTTYLHQYFLGPFTDSNEIKKLAFEIGEHYDVDFVYLIEKADYANCLLRAANRDALMDALAEAGDEMKVDPDGSGDSIWSKIFN